MKDPNNPCIFCNEKKNNLVDQNDHYYASYDQSITHTARLAFTPKIASYKETAVWIIGEYSNHQIDSNNYENILPVIRLLKNNYLVEFGGNGNDTFFTFMVHF